MPTTVRPRGPLPARVYWTRRFVVIGLPLLLVVVIARVLGGSSDGADAGAETATQAGATTQVSETPTSGPTKAAATKVTKTKKQKAKAKKKRNRETTPPEPVLAEPTGPCTPSDIVATPAVTQVPGGADAPLTLTLRTIATEACTWRASADTMTVTITSGSDFIWSSRECPASIPAQDVVVRSAVDTSVVVTWSARRSDEGCPKATDWALPGFYHVEAAALGGDGTDVQFELVAPQPGVITKTAEPQQQGGKGGKKNADTSHTPGEDGAGNSEG